MIEKIRVSLWEVFSFLMTGLLAIALVAMFVILFASATASSMFAAVKAIPTAVLLAVGPLISTLLGMLIEPFANYADRIVLNRLLGWVWKQREKDAQEEKALKEEIRDKYLGALSAEIKDSFQICKDYVEIKELSTNFMIYLARYGFYRNCTFLAACSGLTCLFLGSGIRASASFLCCFVVAAVTKRRQEDFYSYMAPTVYRAFLIDKIDWKPRIS